MSKYELPITTPEAAGVPSEAIGRFLARLEEKNLPMHSVLMLRRGELFFETYWKPFDENRKHRMYSTSKSFVSAAIGILIGEGKLSLDDKVADFFPDKAPADMHPYTAVTTIRDLLVMATPFGFGTCTYNDKCPDWADTYFQAKPSHLPGKIFSYDTTATVMLSIIVKRVSGVEFTEYLRDRFFAPAGMNTDIWCVETPCGHEWGGSGVMCTPRDLMKFALTFLNGGSLNGVQIVPEDYARAATSRQIDNSFTAGNAEHAFGYGYQFWRTRYNGWACRGMGSQLAIVLPDYDFILVTTGDTQAVPAGAANIYDALWAEILPFLRQGQSLPADEAAHKALLDATAPRDILCRKGKMESPLAAAVSGRKYIVEDNPMNLKWFRLTFEGSEGVYEYENATGVHAIRFGFGHQVAGVFPETHYYGKRIGTPANRGYECHASAAWVGEQGLLVWCYITDDHVGTLKMNFAFEDDRAMLMSYKNAEWFLQEYEGEAAGIAE